MSTAGHSVDGYTPVANSAAACCAVKLSSQVKQAVLEVEEYIRREGWPAVPSDIMKVC